MPAEGQPLEEVEPAVESWLAGSGEASLPLLAEGGRALAERTWLCIEKAAPTLSTLPALLQGVAAPEEDLQRAALLGSLLLDLPQQMASGQEASLARVDRLFSRLLNAPGRSGVIEQVIDELAANAEADGRHAEYDAGIEVLREMHRDLVTLQQTWDALLEATYFGAFPLLASPRLSRVRQEEPAGLSAALAGAPAPHASTPLPAWGGVIRPVSGGVAARSFRPRPGRKREPRLVLVLAVLVLLIAGTGVLLLQGARTPASHIMSTAIAGNQHTPLVGTPTPPTHPQPTATQSAATPIPPSPQPTTSPSPQPTSPGALLCPTGSPFCVSTLQVQVSCSGNGSATFQLQNHSASKTNWQTSVTPGPGGTQVTITPSSGKLKVAQLVTLTVQTSNQGQMLLGAITIVGPDGTAPITVAVQGCG